MSKRMLLLAVIYIIVVIQLFAIYHNTDKPLLAIGIVLTIMFGLWYDKKIYGEICRRNKFPTDFTSFTYTSKLYRLLSTHFDNSYTIHIVTLDHLAVFLKRYGLTDKLYEHLEEPCRIDWIKQKMIGIDEGLYVFLLDRVSREIIATIGFSQYKTLFTDVYPELYKHLKVKVDECINGNTLIVNKDYRGKGIASKLKTITNDFWLEYYDYVIGNTDSIKAKDLYVKLGATVAFEECFEDDIYYYYYWKKENKNA